MWTEDIREQIDQAIIPVHGQIVIDAIKKARCVCDKCNFCKDPHGFYYALQQYVHYKRALHICNEIIDTDFPWASTTAIRSEMPNRVGQLMASNPNNRFYRTILDHDCDAGKLNMGRSFYQDLVYQLKPCDKCIRRFNPTGKTSFMGRTLDVRRKVPKNRLNDEPLI